MQTLALKFFGIWNPLPSVLPLTATWKTDKITLSECGMLGIAQSASIGEMMIR